MSILNKLTNVSSRLINSIIRFQHVYNGHHKNSISILHSSKNSNLISGISKPFTFSDYDCIGFDLDNTLCKYKVGPMLKLEYNAIANFLVTNKNYSPKYLLKPIEENLDFLLKGLVLDFQRGNVLKINSNGKIITASHGTKPLSKAEIEKQYGIQKHWNVTDTFVNNFLTTWNGPLSQQMRSLLDYFDMPTALAFARIVDTLDEIEGKPLENYNIWPDLLAALTDMFEIKHFEENKGGYFPIIKSNPDQYIHKCSDNVLNWLKSLKKNNKKLFLITGSHIDFASLTSRTCMGDNWAELFDILIFFARKPGFFTDNRPFLNPETLDKVCVSNLKQNGSYVQGNWRDLNLFFSKITKKCDPKIVYIGDNLIQDVYTPVMYTSCDSVAVCEELEAEGVYGFNREHEHIEHLTSQRWGSFFSGNDEGNNCETIWFNIIRKYSRIFAPNIDYFASKPIDYQFKH